VSQNEERPWLRGRRMTSLNQTLHLTRPTLTGVSNPSPVLGNPGRRVLTRDGRRGSMGE